MKGLWKTSVCFTVDCQQRVDCTNYMTIGAEENWSGAISADERRSLTLTSAKTIQK